MIRVKVTQEHLDKGWQGDCTKCPLAWALREMGYNDPWVDEGWVALDGAAKKNRYEMSKYTWDLIDDFDKGYEVEPFEVVLTRRVLPMAIDLTPTRHEQRLESLRQARGADGKSA